MRYFEGCTAIITGASSGFGSEFARQLAPVARGIVLVARRGDRLVELRRELEERYPKLAVLDYVMDLTDGEQIEGFAGWLERSGIAPNFLINNAGVGDRGRFAGGDWDRVRAMIELNVVALTRLTHCLLPLMKSRGRGAILNVSSIAGLLPLPHMSVYAATKAYVNSFSDGLRMELHGSGIIVTAVLPGPAETEFGKVADRGTGEAVPETPRRLTVSVEEVVRTALGAVAKDRARVIPGARVAMVMGVAVALPLGIVRRILQSRTR